MPRWPLIGRITASLAAAAVVVVGLGLLVVDRYPARAGTGRAGRAIEAAKDRDLYVPGVGYPAVVDKEAALPAKPDTETINALLNAAGDARTRKDWPRAIELYRRVVDDAPKTLSGHLLLGFCLLQSGDVAGARAAYEVALERNPQSPEAANGLAWTLIQTSGSAERAVKLAELAVEHAPTAYYLDTLARAYLKAGDCARAAKAAHQALTAMPEEETFRQLVEVVRRACGDERGTAPPSGP
jgi:Flp pilus assembly protein TadD